MTTEPFKNKLWERYCQNVVAGNNKSRSYLLARPDGAASMVNNVARSLAYSLSKKPAIIARIEALKEAKERPSGDDDDLPTKEDIRDIFESVTAALLKLLKLANQTNASHIDKTKIKRALTLHTGRASSYMNVRPATATATAEIDLTGPLTRMFICECDR